MRRMKQVCSISSRLSLFVLLAISGVVIADKSLPTTERSDIYTKVKNCAATTKVMPICASDGNTYLNVAMFDCANKNTGGSLEYLHDGSCQNETEHYFFINSSPKTSSQNLEIFSNIILILSFFLSR